MAAKEETIDDAMVKFTGTVTRCPPGEGTAPERRNMAERSSDAGAATPERWPIRSCTSSCAGGSRCGCGASNAAGCDEAAAADRAERPSAGAGAAPRRGIADGPARSVPARRGGALDRRAERRRCGAGRQHRVGPQGGRAMAVIHEHLSRRRDDSAGDTIAAVSTSQAEKQQIVGHGRRPAWETRFLFAGRHDRHALPRRAERRSFGKKTGPYSIAANLRRCRSQRHMVSTRPREVINPFT
jgi:hypothetical protein